MSPTRRNSPPILTDREVPRAPIDRSAEDAARHQRDPSRQRRADDQTLGKVAEKTDSIGSLMLTTHKYVLAGLYLGGSLAVALLWFGWKQQSPGARIDGLVKIFAERDSVQRIENHLIREEIAALRDASSQISYQLCRFTVTSKPVNGGKDCAEEFLFNRTTIQRSATKVP